MKKTSIISAISKKTTPWHDILKSLENEQEGVDKFLINKKLLIRLLTTLINQPLEFSEIVGGYSKDTYHYRADNFVLCLPKPFNPLHRHHSIEVENLYHARLLALTPLTIIANYSKHQLLVTKFIPNYQTFTADDFQDPVNLIALADLVKKLHYSAADFKKNPETALSFIDSSSNSFKNISFILNAEDYQVLKKCDELRALLAKFPVVERPSHGDLHHFNIINNNNVMQLVDFELSSVEDPANDIARFFCVTGLNKEQQQIFLNAYKNSLGEILTKADMESLQQRIQLFEPLHYFSIAVWAKYAIQFYEEKRVSLQAAITHYSEKTFECLNNIDVVTIQSQIHYFQHQPIPFRRQETTKVPASFFRQISLKAESRIRNPKLPPTKSLSM